MKAFLGQLVLWEEAANKKPLGMETVTDTGLGCELDICWFMFTHKHGLPYLYPLHQTFPAIL